MFNPISEQSVAVKSNCSNNLLKAAMYTGIAIAVFNLIVFSIEANYVTGAISSSLGIVLAVAMRVFMVRTGGTQSTKTNN